MTMTDFCKIIMKPIIDTSRRTPHTINVWAKLMGTLKSMAFIKDFNTSLLHQYHRSNLIIRMFMVHKLWMFCKLTRAILTHQHNVTQCSEGFLIGNYWNLFSTFEHTTFRLTLHSNIPHRQNQILMYKHVRLCQHVRLLQT